MLPKISIVTPSLNQGKFIRQTIESVLSQEYPRLEYWVIDGGSTDETLKILGEYEPDPRFHWLSEPDQGQANAINKGWQISHGQIIAWLNADDAYRPKAIARAVDVFLAHPEAVLVCGGAYITDDRGHRIGQIPAPHLDLEGMLNMREFLPQPAVFLQARAVVRQGCLNEGLHYAMDFDLFLRLAAAGPVLYLDDYLADYRFHHDSKTSTAFYKLRKEAAHVLYSFLTTQPVNGLSPASKRRCLSYAHLVEAYADFRLGQRRGLLVNTAKGLFLYPLNVYWLVKRILRHLAESSKV